MSLPKSKMISASRAIMSIAAAAKYRKDENHKTIQKQTVNINLANHNPNSNSNRTIHSTPQVPQQSAMQVPKYPEIVERDVKLDIEDEPVPEPITETAVSSDVYVQLQNLHSMLNNYETVAQALILIIDLIQSNPLMINKLIVPTEDSFRELLMVLTGAEDVDFKYLDDVGCTLSSKRYRLLEEIFITKDTEPRSLKYAYPEVARLFDRFKISTKMVACKVQ